MHAKIKFAWLKHAKNRDCVLNTRQNGDNVMNLRKNKSFRGRCTQQSETWAWMKNNAKIMARWQIMQNIACRMHVNIVDWLRFTSLNAKIMQNVAWSMHAKNSSNMKLALLHARMQNNANYSKNSSSIELYELECKMMQKCSVVHARED